MENAGAKPQEISLFLSSLIGYKSLRIYELSIYDRIEATKHMLRYHLDFDDSTAYQAMSTLGMKRVLSFDRDFDRITAIKRIEPGQALRGT
jgi:predicted nucleic acid-binding protein